jgi:hypothetical protein
MLGEAGTSRVADGVSAKLRLGKDRELITGMAHGMFAEASARGNLFMANAIVTAPVIWTTEAGTGGPLLWNGSSTKKASILAVGWGISVVATAAATLGLTAGWGQSAAPTTTTAIDSTGNLLVGGPASACTAYRVGTTVDNKFFIPLGDCLTGALTVEVGHMNWARLDGMITVPPNSYVSIAASATATTLVANFGIIWEELDV